MQVLDEKIAYIEASWLEKLGDEFEKPYMKRLEGFLGEEMANGVVYPPFGQVFNALCQVPFGGVKVVIMGQDPYHGEGQVTSKWITCGSSCFL